MGGRSLQLHLPASAAVATLVFGAQVSVVESHSVAGGAAHTWRRGPYHFESGPSLYSGMNGKLCFQLPDSAGLCAVLQEAKTVAFASGLRPLFNSCRVCALRSSHLHMHPTPPCFPPTSFLS